ncbi:hypothetical protein ABFZ85_07740 [Hyphococcus formosus]|uniref:hypothetical protein n=1 Tax=Hyphococcus formosus TaxID=3143534 RepID=UPI00398AA4C4
MCTEVKHFPHHAVFIFTALLTLALFNAPAFAGSMGSISMGDGSGGITDRAYVAAPPHYLYVVEKERGSFLDCGEGQDGRATDEDGRDMAVLRCGVTLTETIVIPAAASSARIIIHY